MVEKRDEIKEMKPQTADGSHMIFYAHMDILVCAESLVGALDQLKRTVGASDNRNRIPACETVTPQEAAILAFRFETQKGSRRG